MSDNDLIVAEALRAMEGAFATRSADLKSAAVSSTPSVSGLRPCDVRTRRERLLASLRALVDPPGLAEWLNRERPDLLARGRDLVRQIDAAWDAPLDDFERALERFTAHHAEFCQQYRAYLQKHSQGFLEGPGVADVREEG